MERTWLQAGLLTPGDADRLALIRCLVAQGCSLEEMVAAEAEGRLFALAGDRVVRPPGRRRTAAEAAAELGADEARAGPAAGGVRRDGDRRRAVLRGPGRQVAR